MIAFWLLVATVFCQPPLVAVEKATGSAASNVKGISMKLTRKSDTILPLFEVTYDPISMSKETISKMAANIAKVGEKMENSRLTEFGEIVEHSSEFIPFGKGSANRLVYWTKVYGVIQKILQSASPKDAIKGSANGFMKDLVKIDFRSNPIQAMYHLNKIIGPFLPFLHSDMQRVMCGVLLCTNFANLVVKVAKGELHTKNKNVLAIAEGLRDNLGPSLTYIPEGKIKDFAFLMIIFTNVGSFAKHGLKYKLH